MALKIFHFQAENCSVYRKWLQLTHIDIHNINHYSKIPFLPVSFFKSHKVSSVDLEPQLIFTSSSTTGLGVSKHFVPFSDWYTQVFMAAFELFYGSPSQYLVIGLLPSYLERPDSSLVFMVNSLIEKALPGSGTFKNPKEVIALLSKHSNERTVLFGVTYALLDMAELENQNLLKNSIVIETGGMKGRRKEMIREELHATLAQSFNIKEVHSEYGMTEMMSQGYSKGSGIFEPPPWLKVVVKQTMDIQTNEKQHKTGRVCVIDLANLYSCSFIATDDLGRSHENNAFEIVGRFDFSDTRGCNLMWD